MSPSSLQYHYLFPCHFHLRHHYFSTTITILNIFNHSYHNHCKLLWSDFLYHYSFNQHHCFFLCYLHHHYHLSSSSSPISQPSTPSIVYPHHPIFKGIVSFWAWKMGIYFFSLLLINEGIFLSSEDKSFLVFVCLSPFSCFLFQF